VCSKKVFLRDYPRSLVNHFWLGWFPALDTLPVAPALPIRLVLASRRFPVALLRLPPSPLPHLPPTPLAAIALACSLRSKTLCALLPQTGRRRGRRARLFRRPAACFLRERVRFSGGPTGGADSQKLLPWRGSYSSPGRGTAVKNFRLKPKSHTVTENGGWRLRGAPLLRQRRLWRSATDCLGHFFGSRSGSFLESASTDMSQASPPLLSGPTR
jgi:hypothetical protein